MPLTGQHRRWIAVWLVLAFGTAAWIAGCGGCAWPGATELPAAAPGGIDARATENTPAYEALKLSGVRGGRLRFELPGRISDVVDALLDFDHMAGRRPWAKAYRTLERNDARVVAEWTFRGKLGISPKVRIEYRVVRDRTATRIRFHLIKTAFGVAAYFGDFRLAPAGKNRVAVIAQLYIDSGLVFVNASAKDIEAGLREDARQLKAWLRERLNGR